MTETDKRYQRGQIYCIRSPQTEMVYYGSTIQPLYKRFHQHNRDMKRGHYCSSHKILKLGDAYIEFVEDFPCNSKKELERREGQIIRENKQHCVNSNIAGQTEKEWYEANKDAILAQQKEYYEANKEAILAYNKEYKNTNKDVITAQQKEYYEANRDVILEYKKEYREANRDAINAKQRERRHAIKSTALASPSSSSPSIQPPLPFDPSHV